MKILTLNNLINTDLIQYEVYSTPQIQKSNFQKAFYILPKEKRKAINNFYLFCAYLDDIVDNDANRNIANSRIKTWKQIVNGMYQGNISNNLIPLWEVFHKYNIKCAMVMQLIEGIERDLYQNRYANFDDMLAYCYGVASVVGLICIKIFVDSTTLSTKKSNLLTNYAINLGYALQITNIMRDIKEDYNRNYVYMPQEFLTQFNYSENDIKNMVHSSNFCNLMEHLYKKAIEYYNLADKYYDGDPNLQVAQCIKKIYYKLLLKIKQCNYKIYDKKIKITTLEKLLILVTTNLQPNKQNC